MKRWPADIILVEKFLMLFFVTINCHFSIVAVILTPICCCYKLISRSSSLDLSSNDIVKSLKNPFFPYNYHYG